MLPRRIRSFYGQTISAYVAEIPHNWDPLGHAALGWRAWLTKNKPLLYMLPYRIWVYGINKGRTLERETRHPLICRVYNGFLVYSLVALNRIKYHQGCIKTRHFHIKK